ncbi:MAG: hypothetical protein M3N29_04490 [Chloroflexota bacterium]|nr:hypothetical protein [Chloroflexota bacterium]
MKSVCVVADDLIWASRLVAAVERAGAAPVRDGGDAVVVDLNGRTYDGVAAVARAAASGRPTIAVGQHEDVALRKRALAAGARRVYSYNKLHADGPRVIAALLEAVA